MINPILDRELKTRMRTWKTPILLTVYLLAIGIILALIVFTNVVGSMYNRGFDPSIIPTIYNVIICVELALLMLIVPVMTATSISGERQRQTLDLMLCTDISPWKIIFGKISAALLFVLLLIGASMPFIGSVLLFGGLSLLDIFTVLLYYVATSFMLACVGIFTSTHFKKNITSIIMTYVIMTVMYVVPFVVTLMVTLGAQVVRNEPLNEFMEKYAYEVICGMFGANPGFGVLSLLSGGDFLDIDYLLRSSTTFMAGVPTWAVSLVYFVLISTVTLLLSKRRLAKLR